MSILSPWLRVDRVYLQEAMFRQVRGSPSARWRLESVQRSRLIVIYVARIYGRVDSYVRRPNNGISVESLWVKRQVLGSGCSIFPWQGGKLVLRK
jgi:hypothetical protein